MISDPALSADTQDPDVGGAWNTRAIADLVRRLVHARRGISRAEVVDWVSQFAGHMGRAEAAVRTGRVIDVLCELSDIGHGMVRGEPVLVALPERRVSLPDGRIILLGDHGIFSSDGSERLFPETAGPATESLIQFLAASGDPGTHSLKRPIAAAGRWTEAQPVPGLLRKALLLCGLFDPEGPEWSVGDTNAEFLNEWFGLAAPESLSDEADMPDQSQLRVAEAPAQSRLLIEAGPGSGKTFVACERVVSLITQGELSPSRILLLSFTRIAVAELRSRILGRVRDVPNVAALQIRTFDSFAARLLAAAGAAPAGGHDAGIRAAVNLLRSDDPLVADAVGQFEHVIIDEAQDLVGDRHQMCTALLDLLHPTCGITVFGDFAQSIYGYQQRSGKAPAFLNEIAQRPGFACEQLDRDHRTRTPALKDMFSSVRRILKEDPEGSREGYFRVREQIQAAAVENEIAGFQTHLSTTRGLILTRSRRGLFTAAEEMRRAGRSFRLRLPDRPPRIEPWIGALLGGLPGGVRMSRDQFRSAYAALSPTETRGADGCWDVLLDLDASGRDDILVGNVAEGLADPPLDLLCDFEGSTGPLLSTVHAIKGREAERVMLLLTRAPYGNEVDWADEARILYVGATRASTELRTGWINPTKYYTTGEPERYWVARSDHRLIETGLEGDLAEWTQFVRSGHVGNQAETASDIWHASTEGLTLSAYPDAADRLVLRIGGREGAAIGLLSDDLVGQIQSLRQVGPEAALPEMVSGISIVGATTAVVPGRPGELPGLALMPLLGGFARIPR